MTFGKKERMAAVIIGIVAVAAAVHFVVFANKARTYDSTKQEYEAAVQTLSTAEFIRDQEAFEEYKEQTTRYSALVTTVIEELNLETAATDPETSPPLGAVDQWASQTIELLAQLNAQREGSVQLSFLGENGWNLPAQVPSIGGVGALADRVSQLNYAYQQLQYTVNNPNTEAQVRVQYNSTLQALGIEPRETSNFYYQPWNLFFNSEAWVDSMKKQPGGSSFGGGSGTSGLQPFYNWWGLQRFGQAVPSLKKIWVYSLIVRAMQGENPDPQMMLRFGESLEVGMPLGGKEPLNSINKQLQALLDIIDIAERTGIQEISQVKFLRPSNVVKATLKVPGATPPPEVTPAATPDMMGMGMGMGMDMDMMMMGEFGMGGGAASAASKVTPVPDAEAVATGAGVEVTVRGDNASLTRFYYELSHTNRTYGIDDLYYYNTNQGLTTTATIEVITDLKLDGAASAPVDGAGM